MITLPGGIQIAAECITSITTSDIALHIWTIYDQDAPTFSFYDQDVMTAADALEAAGVEIS